MSVAYITNEVIARVDQICTASATHHVKWNHFGNVILPGLLLFYTPYARSICRLYMLELLKFFILVFMTNLTNSLSSHHKTMSRVIYQVRIL